MKNILLALMLSYALNLYAQVHHQPWRYNQLILQANKLLEQQEYSKSAMTFDSAFSQFPQVKNRSDYYDAASAWALSGNPDTAFIFLFKAAESGYSNYEYIRSDSTLVSLKNDHRWKPVMKKFKKNERVALSRVDKDLHRQLTEIFTDDQKYRIGVSDTIKKYGINSPEMGKINRLINTADSINLVKVKQILTQHGWVSDAKGGRMASVTLFLVLQHSDSATMVYYQPLLQEAFEKDLLPASFYATFMDRIAMYQNRPQIYGSQTRYNKSSGKFELWKVEDEINIDKRRIQLGMQPIRDYLKRLGINYNPPFN